MIGGGDGGLKVRVSPVGARIAQITGPTGRRWLVDTARTEPGGSRSPRFEDGTRGGWDECLPSISREPDPNRPGAIIGDHGDFWFRRWELHQPNAHRVVATSAAIDHPLVVTKTVSTVPGRAILDIAFTVFNRSDARYRFLYSAHPLWAWRTRSAIEIPDATTVISAFGDTDAVRDLSDVLREGVSENFKVFVRWAGVARLLFPEERAALVIRQSTEVTPWLGVCVNRNHWPEPDVSPSWIALEPTTAPTDSLAAAIELDAARVLLPGASLSWSSQLEFES